MLTFTNCGKQERVHISELPPLCALVCLKEREGEGLQDRKHVCDLLGHSHQALWGELIDNLTVEDVHKGLPMAMDLVGKDTPFGGLVVKLDARDDPTLLQDEGFVGVVKRSKWKANFGS